MVFKPSPRAAFPASLCRGTVALRRTSGLVPYAQAVARMEARRRAVLAGRARPLVWFLQHPPLFTCGRSARASDLVAPALPLHETPRGGGCTYHGPGQRVVYLVLPLARFSKDLRACVRCLQTAVGLTLTHFGLRLAPRQPAVGVWVAPPDGPPPAKIAAIGLSVRRWVSAHGVSLNVDNALAPYAQIVPCGRANERIANLRTLGVPASLSEVDAVLAQALDHALQAWQRTGVQGA